MTSSIAQIPSSAYTLFTALLSRCVTLYDRHFVILLPVVAGVPLKSGAPVFSGENSAKRISKREVNC